MAGRWRLVALAAAFSFWILASCSPTTATPNSITPITLYTCVNDTTVQPVIQRFEAAHPDVKVDLYRAPTGQLNARVASDVRSGGLKADVVWACDPLTMQDYVAQNLVGGWVPETTIPKEFRTSDSVGVAVLYVVAVTRNGVRAPGTWAKLAEAGRVAVPNPRVAASALGALGYFGTGFYHDLRVKGAVQVSTPDDVTTGVAQGIYDAGITIASSAYPAEAAGSPIAVTWPKPGAVAIYGPIALSRTTRQTGAAQAFISYVTSREGQTVIGGSGSYPTLAGVAGPPKPDGAPTVHPDWSTLASQKTVLLSEYAKIFGG